MIHFECYIIAQLGLSATTSNDAARCYSGDIIEDVKKLLRLLLFSVNRLLSTFLWNIRVAYQITPHYLETNEMIMILQRQFPTSADNFPKKLKTHLFRNALGHLAH